MAFGCVNRDMVWVLIRHDSAVGGRYAVASKHLFFGDSVRSSYTTALFTTT